MHAKARPVAVPDMLDGAAHVARELRDQREAESPSLALGGHEGIEQVAATIGGNAGTVVADAEFARQCASAAPVVIVARKAVAKGGGDADARVVASAQRLAGVGERIGQYLHPAVPVNESKSKRHRVWK